MEHVAIVGAGPAGVAVASRLRMRGFPGRITIFGDEPAMPYERPPLSKGYLSRSVPRESLMLRPSSYYSGHDIDVRLGHPVEDINLAERRLAVAGRSIDFDRLVLATGVRPMRLGEEIGGGLKGVHTLRTLADADLLATECGSGARALVVGGGYIGLELASTFRRLGMEVDLLERGERILQRVAGLQTSDYFRELHTSKGVKLREGAGVVRLKGAVRVEGAELTTGEVIDVDVVVVGIGARAEIGLAEKAGLAVDGGIVVDSKGRTSNPAVWAAGDCTVFPRSGRLIRLESVQNALDQAHAVADNIMAADRNYDPTPWFWSDQYEVKLQIAGLHTGYDHVAIRSADSGALSHWYYAGDRLLAVDAINDPRSFMCARRLLEKRINPPSRLVSDSRQDLKQLLA